MEMRIGDDELWNLVNGAILRFRRHYTRQNPMARYLIQHLLENIIENNAIEVTQWEVQFGADRQPPNPQLTPSDFHALRIIA